MALRGVLRNGPGESVCVRVCWLNPTGRSWEIRGPPHISQESNEGWLRKVHRGHWKDASGSEVRGEELLPLIGVEGDAGSLTWAALSSNCDLGRTGKGVYRAGPGCLLAAFEMVAFKTWVSVGLMPQARHGGRGVWALAVEGSKFDGTGLEKLQIVQTQVAVLAGAGSAAGIWIGLSFRAAGVELPLPGTSAGGLDWSDKRFVALGIKVIFAEDLRKPA